MIKVEEFFLYTFLSVRKKVRFLPKVFLHPFSKESALQSWNSDILHLAHCSFQDKIGSSQIVPNRLKIDFLAFKSLTQLHLKELNICSDTISSLGILRNTLQILSATNCNLNSVSQLLLCDVIHSEEELPSILTSTRQWSWLKWFCATK